jgi:hypothetical protein
MPSDWSQPSTNGYVEDLKDEKTPEEIESERQTMVYLKALWVSARANTKKYMGDFQNAWGYVIGEKRFPAPGNTAAKNKLKNMSRTVRNGMYAMMDHIVSFITDAEPRILMKSLQNISESDRKMYQTVLESELDRLDWESDAQATAWDAEIGSIGLTMFYTKKNALTGELEICSRVVSPDQVYVNKEADEKGIQGHRTRYMVMDEYLSLAEIREMWPDEGHRVKPDKSKPLNGDQDELEYTAKTDDEIVEMPGNEFIVSKDGKVVDQGATVTWAWEARPETRAIWDETHNKESTNGFFCPSCQTNYLSDDPECPDCEGEMEPVEVPVGPARRKFVERVYPFGKCIIGVRGQSILLFEGPNEIPLTRIFPFAMDACYKKPRCFYGLSNYGMLKSNSQALDQNIGLLRDHLRYNAHPPFEYPKSAEEWATAGSGPGVLVGVDDEVVGQARQVPGNNFDYQGFREAEIALRRDGMEITGVDEILTGGSAGPESGEAIKARQIARGKRIAGRLKRHNAYRTDYASIVWELMTKLYTTPRTFNTRGPANQLEAITLTMSQIPIDIIVEVTADPDKVETDRLMGQNLGQFITSGAIFDPKLLPFMDDLLGGFGLETYKAQAIQAKLQQVHQQMASQPPGPPQDPSKVLVAMSDILKVAPGFVSYDQIQQGLQNAGIMPAPPEHAMQAQMQQLAHEAAGQEPMPTPQALPPMAAPEPEPQFQGGE